MSNEIDYYKCLEKLSHEMPEDHVGKVINELLETEVHYCLEFEKLYTYYNLILEDEYCVITKASLDSIFGNLKDLVDF